MKRVDRIGGSEDKAMEEIRKRMMPQHLQYNPTDQQAVLQNAIKAVENVQQTQIQNIAGTMA